MTDTSLFPPKLGLYHCVSDICQEQINSGRRGSQNKGGGSGFPLPGPLGGQKFVDLVMEQLGSREISRLVRTGKVRRI